MRRLCRTPLLLLLLAVLPSALTAQCLPSPIPPDEAPPCTQHYPRWAGELASLGGNALLGGLSAGIMQELRGGSFRTGFTRGALGGTAIYVGKRITAENFDGAGLLGRQVAGVGASVVRNAGEGRGMVERLYLPLALARLELRTADWRVRVTPDLTALGWTAWAVQRDELRLDLGESLSAGTPVFEALNKMIALHGDSAYAMALTSSGVIYAADIPSLGERVHRQVLEHERVHVLQEDQVFLTITDPLEEALLARLPYVGRYATRVDVNLATELLRRLSGVFPKHLERPWEAEAIFFTR